MLLSEREVIFLFEGAQLAETMQATGARPLGVAGRIGLVAGDRRPAPPGSPSSASAGTATARSADRAAATALSGATSFLDQSAHEVGEAVTLAEEPELSVGACSLGDDRLDPLERPLTPKRGRIVGDPVE